MRSLIRSLATKILTLLAGTRTTEGVILFTPRPSHQGEWALHVDRFALDADLPVSCGDFENFETPIRTRDRSVAWTLSALLQADPDLSRRIYVLSRDDRAEASARHGVKILRIVEALKTDPRYAQIMAAIAQGGTWASFYPIAQGRTA